MTKFEEEQEKMVADFIEAPSSEVEETPPVETKTEDIPKEESVVAPSTIEEVPKEEPAKEEPPKVEEPKEEPKVEVKPEGEPVVTPPVVETPPVEDEAYLRGRVKSLLELINELSAKKDESPKAEAEPKVGEVVIPPVSSERINFLEKVTIDDILDDKEKFNEILNSVYQRAKIDGYTEAVKQATSGVAPIVEKVVTSLSDSDSLVNDFYSKNKDLIPVSKYVAAVARNIRTEKPTLTPLEVLDDTAKVVRKNLGIVPEVPKTGKTKDFETPTFAGGSRGNRPTKATGGGLQAEIGEILTH